MGCRDLGFEVLGFGGFGAQGLGFYDSGCRVLGCSFGDFGWKLRGRGFGFRVEIVGSGPQAMGCWRIRGHDHSSCHGPEP